MADDGMAKHEAGDDTAAAESRGRGRRRGGGRAANAAKRSGAAADRRQTWRIPRHRDAFVEPLTADQVETLLDAAYRVLETTGVEFMSAEARRILAQAGASVDEDSWRVRIGRDIIEAAMATAPRSFTVTPHNPAHEVPFSPETMIVSPVASAPNCSDLDRGRRPGARSDFQELLKLTQSFDCIHLNGGYPVEPIDLHPATRHLDALYDILTLTDKVVQAYSLSTVMIEDAMEMTRLAAGLSEDAFRAKPHVYCNVNTNSPLKIDVPMIEGPLHMARRGQATLITPFTLAGAMAPVTIAGAVVQQTAEFLAAATVILLDTPGAPVGMGGFVSNVDMKSGAPAFGTPEYMRGAQMGGQMARRLGVPYRASNVNAANSVDAQAVWETGFSLWGLVTGGVNYMKHGAGWLEGGLVASYEKFIVDCEMLQQVFYYMEPVDVSEDALGLAAMEEVGPGGHFFGCAHTQKRYEGAFYSPFLSDWRTFQAWTDDGARSATERANRIWKETLEAYEPPALDDKAHGDLVEFVERRRQEGGAPTDF